VRPPSPREKREKLGYSSTENSAWEKPGIIIGI
jgi:hypothetical protein